MAFFTVFYLMLFKKSVTFINCDAADDLECPSPDWIENNGFCYQRFLASLTWPEANQACQSLDANLVSIHNQAEQSVMDCKFTFFLFYSIFERPLMPVSLQPRAC